MSSRARAGHDDDKKRRRRVDYPFFLSYRTRWSDNDQYAHVNNVVYYHLFDAVVNTYLIEHCGLVPAASGEAGSGAGARSESGGDGDGDAHRDQIGLVVSSSCEFFFPISFPEVLDLGLRVSRLGTSSVTYEIGVFRAKPSGDGVEDADTPAAVGGYTHVFVDRRSRKSVTMNARTSAGLMKLVTDVAPSSKL